MPTTDQPAKAGGDQAGSVWEQALKSDAFAALDKALAHQQDGTPEETSAVDEQPTVTPTKEEPKSTAPATEPAVAKDAPKEEPKEDATSGLETVPAEYREVVAATLEQRKKELQNGYLKKFDNLAKQAKEVEALLEAQKSLGMDPKAIIEQATAFKEMNDQFRSNPHDFIKRLVEVAGQAPAEPDFDAMTKTEIAQHFQKEVADAKKAAVEEAKKSVAPVLEQTQAAEQQRKVVEWRSQRRDIADDEMALAVALAQKFEQEVLPKGLDAVDAYMQPFIALARSIKTQATTPSAPKTAPKTEVPSRETQAQTRKVDSLESMMEEAARRKGHRSVNDFMRSRKDE